MSFKKTCEVLSGGKRIGCKISGGVLRPALTPVLKKASSLPAFIFAGYSAGNDCYFACDEKYVYFSADGLTFEHVGELAGNSPFIVEDIHGGKPRAVLINGERAASYADGNISFFTYGAKLSCGVMHCGRLFGADADDGLKLVWSGEGGVDDWTENSGSLILDPDRGEILGILTFGGKIIAVRKYGLTVLNMYGSPENFSVAITDTDTDEIYKGTAKVAGGILIFLTKGGLCSFDGARINVIGGDIFPLGCAESCFDKYFLPCREGTLCYDTGDGESFIIDMRPDALCAGKQIYGYTTEGAYGFGNGLYKFESERLNFGVGGKKTVTKIFVDGIATVEISNGNTARVFRSAEGIIRPNLRGENFIVTVTGSLPLKGVTATAEVMNAI